MVTLETGKLYQIKHWEKGWIIAEWSSWMTSPSRSK